MDNMEFKAGDMVMMYQQAKALVTVATALSVTMVRGNESIRLHHEYFHHLTLVSRKQVKRT